VALVLSQLRGLARLAAMVQRAYATADAEVEKLIQEKVEDSHDGEEAHGRRT
jgi:hypothetical protein